MSIIPSLFGRKGGKLDVLEPVTLDIYDPFEGFSFAVATSPPSSGFGTTPMDWKETPDAHVYISEIPGVKKDEVKIEVEEQKVLKISGQRSKEKEDKHDKWHWVERSSEKFLRSVRLPPNAKIDGMKAVLENGVLTVTVPKEQGQLQGGRLIQITG